MSYAEQKYLKPLLDMIKNQDREAWFNFCVFVVVGIAAAWWML